MEENMTVLGNITWLIFGGFLSGIAYIIGGLMLCLTVVGIPFGVQAIKIGVATWTPFGEQIIIKDKTQSVPNTVFNLIWLILFGWEIALSHLVHGIVLGITIVGLPFAKQHFKLIPLALMPFGRDFIKQNV